MISVPLMRARRNALLVLASTGAVMLVLGDLLILIARGDADSVVGHVAGLLWADGEANLWAWFSSAVLALVAMGFLLLRILEDAKRARRARRALLFCALIAVAMSADEVAALHEKAGSLVPSVGALTWPWLAFGVPLAVVIGVALLAAASALDSVLRRRLVIAGAVYLCGALGIEALGGLLVTEWHLSLFDPVYVLEVTVEEALELAGSLLALKAVLAAADRTASATRSAEEVGVGRVQVRP